MSGPPVGSVWSSTNSQGPGRANIHRLSFRARNGRGISVELRRDSEAKPRNDRFEPLIVGGTSIQLVGRVSRPPGSWLAHVPPGGFKGRPTKTCGQGECGAREGAGSVQAAGPLPQALGCAVRCAYFDSPTATRSGSGAPIGNTRARTQNNMKGKAAIDRAPNSPSLKVSRSCGMIGSS